MVRRLIRSPAAEGRIAALVSWLRARPASEEVLVIGPSLESVHATVRRAARGTQGAFGWHRTTLGRLAAELAAPGLAADGLVPVGRLVTEAVLARVLHALAQQKALGRFADVVEGPGLARALASALAQLRASRVDVGRLPEDLKRVHDAFVTELALGRFADRAEVFRRAIARAADVSAPHALVGLPLVLSDLPQERPLERDLVAALAARAPEIVATVPGADHVAARVLEEMLGVAAEDVPVDEDTSLSRLQRGLFNEATLPENTPLDDGVLVLSAPGENRECVEMARRMLRWAGEGIPFDRMAVLLRSPGEYRAYLEEVFARAHIPAWFARGTVRPDPAGRAFAALVACAAEGLSAKRFAEYLSLSETPEADAAGEPPAPAEESDRWVAPDEEMLSEVLAEARTEESDDAGATGFEPLNEPWSPKESLSRSPRHWEQLLVDAAVIGGLERWDRRLSGLDRQLVSEMQGLEDADDPRRERYERRRRELEALRAFALPLLRDLASWPVRATWDTWLLRLSALATRALRRPERVLSVLSELSPLGPVGPVDLTEVQRVLLLRLLELSEKPLATPAGRVFVGTAEVSRGLAFDVVFVPGLAERLFPRKIVEEPILLDAARRALDKELPTTLDRVASERLFFHLAVGAARKRLVLSYPRLDLDQGRPRVPSFYALEALRAAEGRLPSFTELATRAETSAQTRVGWPAPADPSDAIDEAEHDLALLDSLLHVDEHHAVGTARYLLLANPHLARALRFRARRWLSGWTVADGLVKPSEAAREAISAHALDSRPFSPTALQSFASCPYRFFLYAVHRLAPREVPVPVEELNPLQRGSLFHDAQFEFYTRLKARGLHVRSEDLDEVRHVLDEALDAVALSVREDLAPAIERVWDDGIATLRADLREWLRRVREDASGFDPWRFELSFGLRHREKSDDDSRDDPVELSTGLKLRGAIDLIERDPAGRLRVTDHKTGKVRVKKDLVVGGGQHLQPVLYAQAVEALFPGAQVTSGRLFYCTTDGGFEVHDVPFDDNAKKSILIVVDAVRAGLSDPFLPAAPAPGACQWCDYRVVCGPHEELRLKKKRGDALVKLKEVRKLP